MKFGHFFIDHPRFAAVVAILITLVGALSYFGLTVAQYPEVVPPTVIVRAVYPGAAPEVIAETVATPIEQEVNGVDGMLYMASSSTTDGVMQLTITFEIGTDLDTAQVLVQNRVAVAEARLPEEVRRLGVTTVKSSPDLMIVVHLSSPDQTYDQLYISNYASLHIRDVLKRLDGVGSITIFGEREYSMRVWLDPERMQSMGLAATDVVEALREQNVQVAGGILGQPPMPFDNAFQYVVNTTGRFIEAEEFEQVIIKSGEDGRLIRLVDVARVELGSREYVTNSHLDGQPAVGVAVFQRPGSNALETAESVKETMKDLAEDFPDGLDYDIVYNPTDYIEQSVHAVYATIFEAIVLVILVILLFLQSWRAALIPILTIPVSLIGTFAVLSALGFSLNNLSLFGLVLAIGIVVDDAIVVVENIERNLARGMTPHAAARMTMDEVGRALVSIGLVLTAVFIPSAFLGGISGQFFQQFAVTITAATLISVLTSLSLSPALGAILLRPPGLHERTGVLQRLFVDPVFRTFNRSLDTISLRYGSMIGTSVTRPGRWMLLFLALLATTAWLYNRVPGGFIPEQDQGYLIVAIELPKGATLQRTDDVVERATEIILATPGVGHTVAFAGLSGATFSNATHAGTIFVPMKPFAERGSKHSAKNLVNTLQQNLAGIQDAQIFVFMPPPIRGMGTGNGFKMMIEDRAGRGLGLLESATQEIITAANDNPVTELVFTTFSTAMPQYFVDIDRTRAEMLNVPTERVFDALEIYLGSSYINDYNQFGRTYRVTAQADAPYRLEIDDINRLRVRSEDDAMVPLGSLARVRSTTGPDRIVRYNLYPAAEIQGSAVRGHSSAEALEAMEKLAGESLPGGLDYEWTELAYQERRAGNVGLLIFPLSVIFVLLVLTAQYESWSLPLAVILILPLVMLFSLIGLMLRGMDNNILTQIGFVVLAGLSSKNAILIVEFAHQLEAKGKDRWTAAKEAAVLRLRPILMTSFAFILGVVPLVLARGAGEEMRQMLGTTVFSGMIGVTLIGLLLTPVFYVLIRAMAERKPGGVVVPD